MRADEFVAYIALCLSEVRVLTLRGHDQRLRDAIVLCCRSPVYFGKDSGDVLDLATVWRRVSIWIAELEKRPERTRKQGRACKPKRVSGLSLPYWTRASDASFSR